MTNPIDPIDPISYVRAEDIRDAVLEAISGYARDNAERVIGNCGYHLATDIVNEHLGPGAPDQIAARASEVINDLSQHTLFHGGGYGRPASEARKLLDNAVRENKDALSAAVNKAIHNLSKAEIVDIVKSGKVKLVIE